MKTLSNGVTVFAFNAKLNEGVFLGKNRKASSIKL